MTNRDKMSNASSRFSDAMKIHKCQSANEMLFFIAELERAAKIRKMAV